MGSSCEGGVGLHGISQRKETSGHILLRNLNNSGFLVMGSSCKGGVGLQGISERKGTSGHILLTWKIGGSWFWEVLAKGGWFTRYFSGHILL